MNHASLTARYRPQTFAEVAGQDTVKAILSRAAAEDRVAPAYLFSGTRGVGKTTIARIFAKALNCEHAPVGEPCNMCEACRKITQSMAVDVVEIDGASNRGIEDAKRLKENIGYAPLEGRYKVFIIDEAHMLTREAFNALLKTLEEPPARVTFLLATTEPHKFPVTIISRCQHFVFKRLSQAELERHLVTVLNRENINFESEALALIARRASGSVRDSMSLLGQVLALGENGLTAYDTREVLGLAGQDAFFTLLDAILAQDCLAVVKLVRLLLDRGADIGFFLRELTSLWRNLFILAQAGENGLTVIDLPEAESTHLLRYAKALPLTHIHACWQMTIEGQRRVLTSIEPAQALELLLLNLAALPRLMPVQNFRPASSEAAMTTDSTASAAPALPVTTPVPAPEQPVQKRAEECTPAGNKGPVQQVADIKKQAVLKADSTKNTPKTPQPDNTCLDNNVDATSVATMVSASTPCHVLPSKNMEALEPESELDTSASKIFLKTPPANPIEATRPQKIVSDAGWNDFIVFCKEHGQPEYVHILGIAKGFWPSQNELCIEAASALHLEQMQTSEFTEWVRKAAQDFRKVEVCVRVSPPPTRKSKSEQREELLASPTVKLVSTHLSATLLEFWDKEPK